jgi:endoglucanase
MRIAGRILSSRACDDAVGTASVMCAMELIVRRRIDADVTALLTRAEEAGLVGALAACKARTLAADALVVAIETSKAQPGARLGDGVVIRVGDRARTFDPSLTGHLVSVAGALAKRDKQFRYVRQLMPGGTCESTAYMVYGYCTAALCIPLGNYHNMGSGNRIASEQVHTGDFENLVKLLAALAADKSRPADTDKALRQRRDSVLKQRGKYLE